MIDSSEAERPKKQWTMSRGAIYNRERVYVLAYSEDEPGTRVFRWTGRWDNYHVPFITAGICAVSSTPPEIVTVGADGSVHIAGPGGFVLDHVDRSQEGPEHRGVIRAVNVIDEQIFVTGMARQIYERLSAGIWARMDSGILDPRGSENVCGFESIDGFSRAELYAVGLNGEVAVWQHGKWRIIDSPTNMILHKVVCAPNGTVYAAGQVGTILKGRLDQWTVIHQDLTEDTFWDAAWFQNYLWLSTTSAIFRLDRDSNSLAAVNTEAFYNQSCRYLDARDGVLWSLGSENLAYFDGVEWTIVELP